MVTRSAERAGPLLQVLEQLGAEPVPCPLTRICGPAEADAEKLAAAIERLSRGQYDWLVFSSANAVERLLVEMRTAGLGADVLSGVRIACVGPATERALRVSGLAAQVVPQQSDAEGLGRAVVEAAGVQIASTRVLVPRAEGGKSDALDALREAGAAVDAVTLYRSCTAEASAPEVAAGLELLRSRGADVVAFFAPSQVRAAIDLLGRDACQLIAHCRVVAAIGRTTRAALEERGIAVQAVPSSPTPEALASAIAMEYAVEAGPRPDATSDER